MSEVKRYKVDDFRLDNPTTARTHLMVHAELFDAERLRADTAEAELKRLDNLDTMQLIAELTNRNATAEQRIAELEGREVLAEAEGVLTFMRSDSDGCSCCEGHHVFCRYFEGVRSFDDFSQNARFRNDLEGRRFRISIELIPDAALNPNPESHYSDCATNNRGVPELLGPCDCGYEGDPK